MPEALEEPHGAETGCQQARQVGPIKPKASRGATRDASVDREGN